MHGIIFLEVLITNLQELERFCPVDVSFKLIKHVGSNDF